MTEPGPVLICAGPDPDVARRLGEASARLLLPGGAVAFTAHAPHRLPLNPIDATAEALLHVPAEFEAADRAAAEAAAAAACEPLSADGWAAQARAARDARAPWTVALELAGELGARLIVAGSGRHYLPRPGALGHETRALAHHSRHPLLVIPDDHAGAVPQGPVVFAYDGTPAADHALDVAVELLAPAGAVIVAAWPPLAATQIAFAAAPASMVLAGAADLDEQARAAAAQTARAGAERLAAAGWDAEAVEVAGPASAWPPIVDVAHARAASLVVTGARHHSRLYEALLGSVGEGLLRHAGRPVLLVPPVE